MIPDDASLPFRVLPEVTVDTEFFWYAGAESVLKILRCQSCGYFCHPPYPRCPICLSRSMAPETVTGRGEVHSFTINHQQWVPGTDPYAIVLVELDEQTGLRLTSSVIDVPVDEVKIGLPLEVDFLHREDVWLPLFRRRA